jgi:adenine phosphoribosyltransferase
MDTLKARIRHVPDFPKPGILFYDITPLLNDPQGFRDMIDALSSPYAGKGVEQVVAIESRGFILGGAVANTLNAGFVPIRKQGKLPSKTHREDYALEYGTDCLEIHCDALQPGQKVLLVDDVLATGGTAAGTARLVEKLGGHIAGFGFVIELDFLDGRKKLPRYDIHSLIHY